MLAGFSLFHFNLGNRPAAVAVAVAIREPDFGIDGFVAPGLLPDVAGRPHRHGAAVAGLEAEKSRLIR